MVIVHALLFVFFSSSWCRIVTVVPHLLEPHHAKMCLRRFSSRSDSNQPAQLQKLARILKLWISQVYISYYLSSEQQRC